MKLISFQNFEMPAVFARFSLKGTRPPPTEHGIREHRHVQDVINHPIKGFYDPNSLHFRQATIPTVPGNGGYVTCGLGPIVYDHQATWCRDNRDMAGPVRSFFRSVLTDNRVKHL